MVVHEAGYQISVSNEARIHDGFVFGIYVTFLPRKRNRKVSIAFGLGIEHCPQRQHPGAVTTRGQS